MGRLNDHLFLRTSYFGLRRGFEHHPGDPELYKSTCLNIFERRSIEATLFLLSCLSCSTLFNSSLTSSLPSDFGFWRGSYYRNAVCHVFATAARGEPTNQSLSTTGKYIRSSCKQCDRNGSCTKYCDSGTERCHHCRHCRQPRFVFIMNNFIQGGLEKVA